MGAIPVAISMPNLRHISRSCALRLSAKNQNRFLPSPNNPTGTQTPDDEIYFIYQMPDHVILCLDEAYAEYLEDPPDLLPFLNFGKKL